MSNYLIFFGDDKFKYQKHRLKREANDSGWFKDIFVHSPESLLDFFDKNNLTKESKGYGYWIWKPYIILELLNNISPGDVLVYIDAGGSILKHKEQRFKDYVDILKNSTKPIITFREDGIFGEIKYKEKFFQKMGTLKNFNLDEDEEFLDSGQVEGGVFMCMKNEFTVKFVQEWLDTLLANNLTLAIDEDTLNQKKEFVCYRHDQSILSILCKLYGTILIDLQDCYGKGPFFSSRMTDIGPRKKAPDGFRKQKTYDFMKHPTWREYLEDDVVKKSLSEQIKKLFYSTLGELRFFDADYDLKNEFATKIMRRVEEIQFKNGLYKVELNIDEIADNVTESKKRIVGNFSYDFLKGDSNNFSFLVNSDGVYFYTVENQNERLYSCKYIREWNCNY